MTDLFPLSLVAKASGDRHRSKLPSLCLCYWFIFLSLLNAEA